MNEFTGKSGSGKGQMQNRGNCRRAQTGSSPFENVIGKGRGLGVCKGVSDNWATAEPVVGEGSRPYSTSIESLKAHAERMSEALKNILHQIEVLAQKQSR